MVVVVVLVSVLVVPVVLVLVVVLVVLEGGVSRNTDLSCSSQDSCQGCQNTSLPAQVHKRYR